jgi:excisionase family DNA binding protein
MKLDSITNNLISPEELMKLLNISKSSVYRLVNKRHIPFYKVGGKLRFSKADVEKYLKNVRIDPVIK